MICPECGENTEVIDSRKRLAGMTVRRRRRCKDCGYRFSTIEAIVKDNKMKDTSNVLPRPCGKCEYDDACTERTKTESIKEDFCCFTKKKREMTE